LRNNDRVEENEYLTDALSREAANYIEKYQDEPFFIYLAYNAPHAPLQATEKYLNRFDHISDSKRKKYAAMVSSVDDGVGLVLNKLKELDIEENTIVVFLSDNGGPEPNNGSDNGPLKGKKGDLWEGGIRVPFAMQWPAKIQEGTVFDDPIISLDIFATIAAQNKESIVLKKPLDGVNLLPYLEGEAEGIPHPLLFWKKYDQERMAVRKGKDKLVKYAESISLYNLDQDIGEEINLLERDKKTFQELQNAYNSWNNETKDPTFLGLIHNKKYNQLHPDRWGKNKAK
jgi:arylsulfatase A-like enzyme